jgi:hypothetical protein
MPEETKILGPTEILFMRRSRSKYMQAHSCRSLRTEQHDDDGVVPLSIASLQIEGISKPHLVSAGKATAPAAANNTTNATHIAMTSILAMILVVFDLSLHNALSSYHGPPGAHNGIEIRSRRRHTTGACISGHAVINARLGVP